MLFTEIPENVAFFDYFTDEQKQFNERYHKLDDADLFEAFNIEGDIKIAWSCLDLNIFNYDFRNGLVCK